jgi:hypothetical protein
MFVCSLSLVASSFWIWIKLVLARNTTTNISMADTSTPALYYAQDRMPHVAYLSLGAGTFYNCSKVDMWTYICYN